MKNAPVVEPPCHRLRHAFALVPRVLVPLPPPDLLHDARVGHLPVEPLQEILPVHILIARVHLSIVVHRVGNDEQT